MKVEDLERASFAVGFLGLLLMYSATFLGFSEVSVSDIDRGRIGDKVEVAGEVSSSHVTDENSFLTLEENGSKIEVAWFGETKRFAEGENVAVEGEVTLYEGETEIVAEEVEAQ